MSSRALEHLLTEFDGTEPAACVMRSSLLHAYNEHPDTDESTLLRAAVDDLAPTFRRALQAHLDRLIAAEQPTPLTRAASRPSPPRLRHSFPLVARLEGPDGVVIVGDFPDDL